jgi:aspartyl/asparaginyl beta-hydroxylase (cupin superfamily)
MKLDPGGSISKHRDHDPNDLANYDIFRDGIAVNLAITHPEECTMIFEDTNIVPWTPGSAIMLNVSKYHSVVNASNLPRVHMIAHAIIGDRKQEFCDLLYRSYKKYHA